MCIRKAGTCRTLRAHELSCAGTGRSSQRDHARNQIRSEDDHRAPCQRRSRDADLSGDRQPMSRMIEIVLFMTPFLSFAAWRAAVSLAAAAALADLRPDWFPGMMLLALVWSRHFDAGDARKATSRPN